MADAFFMLAGVASLNLDHMEQVGERYQIILVSMLLLVINLFLSQRSSS